MDVGLTLGAVLFGIAAGVICWQKPLKAQFGYLGLSLLLTIVMIGTRLSVTEGGTGFIDALTNPPYWKLLVVLLADIGIVSAMLLKGLKVGQDSGKRKSRRRRR
jgi:hypothetical protein